MDVSRFVRALLEPAPPEPPLDDVDAVLRALPATDEDGKAIRWTRRDAVRLVFGRWLRRSGRLNDD